MVIREVARPTIVFIHDDLAINGNFCMALEADGWQWIEVTKTDALQGELRHRNMLVAILASTMNASVHEFIGDLLVKHNVPVVVFCATYEILDCCQALEEGAEDVISVPFAQAEVLARLRAVARVRFATE